MEKGKMEIGKGRLRWFVTMLFVATSPFSLLHSPLRAQQLTESELPPAISSRSLPLRFEHLNVNHGLTQNSVYSIMQDRHGFMWFGTQSGLNRFDGYNVKTYESMPFDSTSAPGSSWMLDLEDDSLGYIWIAATGDGVARFDPSNGEFEYMRHDPNDPTSIAADVTISVLVDAGGSVWVTSIGGLCRYEGETKFTCFGHNPDDEASISSDTVFAVWEDFNGRIWAQGTQGLDRMDEQRTGRFENVSRDFIGGLEREEEPGIFWGGTQSGALARFDTETGVMETYPALHAPISSLVQDPGSSNVIWVGSMGDGFGRFDLRSKTFLKYEPDAADTTPLTDKNIFEIKTDRSGAVWIGTMNSGVVRFNPTSVGLAHLTYDPRDVNSLIAPSVWGVVQERNGVIWVTTGGQRFQVTRVD